MNGAIPPQATIVVFESKPRWAPELEHQFVDELAEGRIRIVGRSRLKEFEAEIDPQFPTVLLLDMASDPPACLTRLGRTTAGPRLPTIVVLTGSSADLEWTTRELGATSVVDAFVPGHVLADLCRRLFRPARTSYHEY